MKEFLYGPTELCETNKAERSAIFEISNDDINRRNVVNRTYGIDYRNYAKNPTVLFAHVSELPVGRSAWPVKIKKIDDKRASMLAKVMFGNNDFAEKIRLDVEDENSGIKHASIGIDPVEEYYFEEAAKKYKEWYDQKPKKNLFKYNHSSELGEWSIVPLAANVTADKEGYSLNGTYIREVFSSLDTSTKNAAVIAVLDQYIDRLSQLEEKFEEFMKSTESTGRQNSEPERKQVVATLPTGVVSLTELDSITKQMTKILRGL